MDTIGIGHWGYWASYPRINVHIICEGGSHQPVPEVFIPQAVLGDRLERYASCSLKIEDLGIAGRTWIDGLRELVKRARLVAVETIDAIQISLGLLVIDHQRGNLLQGVERK